jgi:hypothetical protein
MLTNKHSRPETVQRLIGLSSSTSKLYVDLNFKIELALQEVLSGNLPVF